MLITTIEKNLVKILDKRLLENNLTLSSLSRHKYNAYVSKSQLSLLKQYVKDISKIAGYSESLINKVLSNTTILLVETLQTNDYQLNQSTTLGRYVQKEKTIYLVLENGKINLQIAIHEFGHACYFEYITFRRKKPKHAQVQRIIEEATAKLFEKIAVEVIGLKFEWRLSEIPNWLIEYIAKISINDRVIESPELYSWVLDYRTIGTRLQS